GFAPNMARIKTGEYLEAWLRNIASSVAPITLSQYTGIVRNHIKLRLGHIKLSELSPQQIGNLLVDKESSGVGARTINLI
ncbi:MAG: hypothetical protein KAV87_38505, partial [Desulfobacteraceae bacterium]|nr:hypothetical protein [Desulfobacteraceae bacterium]